MHERGAVNTTSARAIAVPDPSRFLFMTPPRCLDEFGGASSSARLDLRRAMNSRRTARPAKLPVLPALPQPMGSSNVKPLEAAPLMLNWTVAFAWSLVAMTRQAPAGRAPAAVGAKVTLRVIRPPASTVNGAADVQVIEPGVAAQDEMPVTFSGAVPAFCTWAPSVFELPTVTVWKTSEAGLSAIAGAAVVVVVPPDPRLTACFA